MKNLSVWLMHNKRRILLQCCRLSLLVGIVILFPLLTRGQTAGKKIVPNAPDITELSLAQNLMEPEIPKKQIPTIEAYQKETALSLKKQGFDVELMRDRQIVVVTIPAASLFSPGNTSMNKEIDGVLGKLTPLMRTPDMYKILVVAHSDNTGSEEYLANMTDARANAVADWLIDHHVIADNIVPYGLGAEEPRRDNSSRAGREANRRIEFYLVPGPQMIILAKTGKL